MTSSVRFLILPLVFAFIAISCEKDALYDLSDDTYQLRNSDSTVVNFPRDFKGSISVVTFVYTNCPDMCTVITANMKNIHRELQDTSGINFIEISFDPERDIPSVLKEYKELYQLDDQFSLLTGNPSAVDTLLSRLDIKAEKTYPDSLDKSSNKYTMTHSNTIYLMDESGYIRFKYPASRVQSAHVIEDLQKLR